jgi:hypothetical protein|tara:strand:+ start:3123 stop:3986 length:864 start_codon:yes stop_codon:yes gene_type:complete
MEKEQEVTLENGEKITIFVKKPANKIISSADMRRAKVWNDCIQNDILTKKELSKVMEKRGIWSKKQSEEEDDINQKMAVLERQLFRGEDGKKPKVSEGRDIALQMRQLRMDLRNLISERISLEENTAEALADNARFDYFVAECTFYKDSGKRVYNNLEDYNTKSSDAIAYAAASMLGDVLYNLDSSFESTLPENKWLKAFNLVDDKLALVNNDGENVSTDGQIINDQGHYINEDGKRVDVDGLPLDDDGTYVMVDYENDLEPAKKKVTRKKTTKKKPEPKETAQTES